MTAFNKFFNWGSCIVTPQKLHDLHSCLIFIEYFLPVLTNDDSGSELDVPKDGKTGLPPNTEKLEMENKNFQRIKKLEILQAMTSFDSLHVYSRF